MIIEYHKAYLLNWTILSLYANTGRLMIAIQEAHILHTIICLYLSTCVSGTLCSCKCVLHLSLQWCAEPIWSAGWMVPEQSIMWWFGRAHTVANDVAPQTRCSWVFVYERSTAVCTCEYVCVFVCEVRSVQYVGVCPARRVCVLWAGIWAQREGLQPAWPGLLVPLCHLLDHSRCHISMDGGKDNAHVETHTKHLCMMQGNEGQTLSRALHSKTCANRLVI